ncbi:MAG: SEC-C domain-containing protein [Burkholderiales bacterium]|nr:SEC-C domain-containing protein [Burkholderiales bacterium]
MKLGRNDPCHCGSGKKYKHCCLLAGAISAAAPADLVWRRLRGLLDGYASRMIRFIDAAYGPCALEEAWDEFVLDRDIEFEPEAPLMQLFMPWFFHSWSPDADTEVADASLHRVIPTAAYLARKRRQLDPLLVRYLESCLQTPLSYYEVTACAPGERIELRDIFTSAQYDVTERSASRSMQRGDLLFGQLAHLDRLTMLEATSGFAIAPLEKAAIVAVRANIAQAFPEITAQVLREYDIELIDLFHDIAERAFNPKLPQLQNTDGDPLSMRKLIYDLSASPQAAFDALKHLALDQADDVLLADAARDARGELSSVSFTWSKRGNTMHPDWSNTSLGTITIDGARLTAEVNSEARADAAAKEIEAALGEGAQFRVTQIQSMEKMLSDARTARAAAGGIDKAQHNELAELPEVRAKVAEMMAAHWERWVDQPIPMLGGRTPIDAVRDRDGREVVESLVIQGERQGRAMNPPTDEAVFRRLRERLGLEPAD